MAKEKFIILAVKMEDDCFGRFSESANKEAIGNGTADESDAYSWIEGSFEIQLRRHREATHLCSFTPSAYYVWLENQFVGKPNPEWDMNGDPDGLERESGGEYHGYGTYRDDYDKRFICETFTIDTMHDLDEPLRAPGKRGGDYADAYHAAIWKAAEDAAQDLLNNGAGGQAPILSTYAFRQWEKDCRDKVRAQSLEMSKRSLEWELRIS